MKVAIYRTVGHLDRQFITTKFFYSWESAERFCKYVAPGLYGYTMKTTSVWVVTLAGEHVHHGHSVQGVIETVDDLRIIREKIKEAYKIEFESENSARDDFEYFYQKYENITDDRDIMLVLERVLMYQNDDLKEQFKELAQQYFGMTMAGLNCKPCDYTTFKKWYDDNHTCEATYEIYLVAQWVWNYYEPNF